MNFIVDGEWDGVQLQVGNQNISGLLQGVVGSLLGHTPKYPVNSCVELISDSPLEKHCILNFTSTYKCSVKWVFLFSLIIQPTFSAMCRLRKRDPFPPLTAPSESWLASFVTSSTAMGEKIVRILPNYYVLQINWYTIGDILIELSFIHLQYEKCGRLAQSIYKYAGMRWVSGGIAHAALKKSKFASSWAPSHNQQVNDCPCVLPPDILIVENIASNSVWSVWDDFPFAC